MVVDDKHNCGNPNDKMTCIGKDTGRWRTGQTAHGSNALRNLTKRKHHRYRRIMYRRVLSRRCITLIPARCSSVTVRCTCIRISAIRIIINHFLIAKNLFLDFLPIKILKLNRSKQISCILLRNILLPILNSGFSKKG